MTRKCKWMKNICFLLYDEIWSESSYRIECKLRQISCDFFATFSTGVAHFELCIGGMSCLFAVCAHSFAPAKVLSLRSTGLFVWSVTAYRFGITAALLPVPLLSLKWQCLQFACIIYSAICPETMNLALLSRQIIVKVLTVHKRKRCSFQYYILAKVQCFHMQY